ncbi:GntP family permease [Tuberibacillus sp. Marseille-P3662]|uniref:GntP family permease n=1 Tax=Tuberibacillus sp. Marseille-P3662 TaxID=1965358 RepID=UPI000A1CB509|nr:SLC13 family permease [Tuberibacillus sp. Marseille-P3662]
MVSQEIILLNLVVSIAIILFLVLKLKLNAAIGLIIASIYMGLASGLGLSATIEAISSGFGGLMAEIGLSIGFGVILGKLLSDSGGAHSIATSLIKLTSKEKSIYALGFAAFILAIPVFYDVTFVILIPLGIQLAKEINKPLPYVVGALVIGAATAHTVVPPTPSPLAATSILNFDLGIMVSVGLVVGILSCLIAMRLYFTLLDKGIWHKETDEEPVMEDNNENNVVSENQPSAILSLVPVFLPIVLILIGTVSSAVLEHPPAFVNFISNQIIALLTGAVFAYFVASKSLNKKQRDNAASFGMQAAGVVLLITGAGGAFGTVIQKTKIGKALIDTVAGGSHSAIILILLSFGIALILRIAQGSGTVAGITTMSIMASAAANVAVEPVWIAMASLAGAVSVGHVNDSGFWVTAKLAGLSIKGGFKTYTLSESILSAIVLCFAMIGALVF